MSDTDIVERLAPCPFCGGEAEMDTSRAYRNITTGDFGNAVAIYCTGCSADICACREDHSGLDDEEIIHLVTEQWNRRPPATDAGRAAVVDIVFDGPPDHESGRFVEVEDSDGRSIKLGEWLQRPDGYWVLRINALKDMP